MLQRLNKDADYMRQALRLAQRGYGQTSPNPMVGAVLVKGGGIIGEGWHRRAGLPHAEIEALHGGNARSATLYVTLEPCSTYGRTPPCTEAIIRAGVARIVVGAIDPNPRHKGKGLAVLRRAGIKVTTGVLEQEATELNVAFNHWIVHRTPFVTVKSAMSLDGKVATRTGESKWITSDKARTAAMHLRQGADTVLVGVNTIIKDNPSLTVRGIANAKTNLRRIVLDSQARTPLDSNVVRDEFASLTTIIVSPKAPKQRAKALAERVTVETESNLKRVLARLGAENVTHLLVEGGGTVNASFFEGHLAHRIAFFYAPKIIGGRDAVKAVAGEGARSWKDVIRLRNMIWNRLGPDLLLVADVAYTRAA
jgi:diaminohydroxyphosphoribosylaminopyrimidine deaminase / 5-amino-6-(5-phosphoribosylamino)uracil reductase